MTGSAETACRNSGLDQTSPPAVTAHTSTSGVPLAHWWTPHQVDAAGGAITLTVAKTFDDVGVDRNTWDDAVALLGGSVYMTWDWLRTWWQFYGNVHGLRLYVCAAADRIVGLIPLYIDEIGLWPLRFRVARLVGANIPPKVFDPPLAQEWATQCVRKVVRHSIATDQCDVISIGPISDSMDAWECLRGDASAIDAEVRVECDTRAVHSRFLLPTSQSEYLSSLCKNEQKNRRKYELRSLRRAHAVEVSVISGPVEKLLREFGDFVELHGQQWQAEGKAGHFGAWPEGVAYNRALVRALGALDRVRFVRISADGITVSSQYIFSFAGRWYWELPARLPGSDWDRFSLGPSGIVTMINEAIVRGVRCIEGGLGHYDYKLRLRAEEHATITFRIYPSRLSSTLRRSIFGCLRGLLRFGYHKMWYRRVMPHLPAYFRQCQWRLWLRWDY
jgi:hypothetical protein